MASTTSIPREKAWPPASWFGARCLPLFTLVLILAELAISSLDSRHGYVALAVAAVLLAAAFTKSRSLLFSLGVILCVAFGLLGPHFLEVEYTSARMFHFALLVVIAVLNLLLIALVRRQEELGRELSRAHQALEFHIHNTPLGAAEFDRNLKIVRWSPHAEKMFGWNASEVIGLRPGAWLIPSEDQAHVEQIISNLTDTRHNFVYSENKNFTKSGRVIECRWYNSVLYDERGTIASILSLVEDVTERNRLAREAQAHTAELEQIVDDRTAQIKDLEQQRAAMEKLSATGRMAARIAHEINNPLGSIKNVVRIVKDALPRSHPDAHYLDLLDREVDRIAHIVRGMYQLHRPVLQPASDISLPIFLRDIHSLVQGSASERGVSIKVSGPQSSESVRFNEAATKQVILNLAHNAIEASRSGQTVEIEAQREGQRLRFRISDHGSGICPETQKHLYEPFFSTKMGSTHGTVGGLGLGLSISHTLTQALGGNLNFESSPTLGTTWFLEVPIILDEVNPVGVGAPADQLISKERPPTNHLPEGARATL